jgi:5,5'-dehydrodivanillate O-demethylase oxygenase subunit
MITKEDNDALTQVGPGTPMGELMRRYWQPIAAATQLDENPVMRVKLLGESLVLYRDRNGGMGLVSDTCAHRRVNLVFGMPESEGIRCPYHGWLYDNTGQCLEMPSEPADSTFPQRIQIAAYPVQELCGLIFAYLGPQPAPLLPRWDLFVYDNVLRDIGFQVLPCNWLQMQENDVDPAHLANLHGRFSNYALERLGRSDLKRSGSRPLQPVGKWEEHEFGLLNLEPSVRPAIFPNVNSFSTELMYRVPQDDTHTLHVFFSVYPMPPDRVIEQPRIPYYIIPPSVDEEGLPIWSELDSNGGQDAMAWIAQGPIVDRTQERLAESDRGIILFREMLRRQMKIVEDGGEPMNVFRDPAKNVCLNITPRDGTRPQWEGPNNIYVRRVNGPYKHSPVAKQLAEMVSGPIDLLEPVH